MTEKTELVDEDREIFLTLNPPKPNDSVEQDKTRSFLDTLRREAERYKGFVR